MVPSIATEGHSELVAAPTGLRRVILLEVLVGMFTDLCSWVPLLLAMLIT